MVDLTAKEFDVIEFLMRNPNRVYSREALLDTIGAPKTLSQIGTPDDLLPVIFKATKDIRDKYVLSRLCWDLGTIEKI